MTETIDRSVFANAYAGRAPWDIGKPQPALVEVAGQISGTVLDSGCGTGDNALFFAERGCQVTGIDYLDEAIQRARAKAAERGIQARFLTMDALKLGALAERFDNVMDCGLFHVFGDADRKRYVGELAAVVKAGGKVFLLCFSDQEPGTQGPRRVSQQELRDAFHPGWVIESIQPIRFAVIPDLKELTFSEGGPKAWLAIIRRESGPAPAIETVVETAVYAEDLERCQGFYRDVLGLPVIGQEPGRQVFFRVGAASVLLLFNPTTTLRGGQLPAHGARGPGHFALGIRTDQLDPWRRHLAAHGVAIEKELSWREGSTSIYFRDPAGNLVELVTPGTWGTPSGW
ncbi:MAG TPA: methyltransferase domain-containing protein [Gemmataceae bacterium]|nr:methyltransferase domain-containing protein [Gemmataceae bacterium]